MRRLIKESDLCNFITRNWKITMPQLWAPEYTSWSVGLNQLTLLLPLEYRRRSEHTVQTDFLSLSHSSLFHGGTLLQKKETKHIFGVLFCNSLCWKKIGWTLCLCFNYAPIVYKDPSSPTGGYRKIWFDLSSVCSLFLDLSKQVPSSYLSRHYKLNY